MRERVARVRGWIAAYISEGIHPANAAALDHVRKQIRDDAVEIGANPMRPMYSVGAMHGVDAVLYWLEHDAGRELAAAMYRGDESARRTLFVLACAAVITPAEPEEPGKA